MIASPFRSAAVTIRLVTAALIMMGMAYGSTYAALNWLRIPGFGSPIWWPTTGFALVILVRCPFRWWKWLITAFVIGYFLANSPINSWSVSITFILTSIVELMVAGAIITKSFPSKRRLDVRPAAAKFIVAVLASIAVGMMLIVISSALFPQDTDAYSHLTGYAISHSLGILVVGPLLVPNPTAPPSNWRSELEFLVVLVASVALAGRLFLSSAAIDFRGFPVLLPVVWAGVRFNAPRTTIVTVVIAALASFGSAQGTGIFGSINNPTHLSLTAQLFIATVAITAMALVIISQHRTRLAAEAREGERTLRRAIRNSMVGMYSIRLDLEHYGQIRDANQAFAQMLGYLPSDLEGQHCAILGAHDDPDARSLLDDYLRKLSSGEIDGYQEESTFTRADGERLWVQVTTTSVIPAEGNAFALVHVHDLTGREQHRRQLEFLAMHDPLTGLANRSLLFQQLEAALRGSRSHDDTVGLLYLDLNKFKDVNDRHGHAAGDAVLVEVGRRLLEAIRPGDTAARIGGDEFAVVCPGIEHQRGVHVIADRIDTAIGQPITLPGGHQVQVTASIGSVIGTVGTDADSLIRRGDAAMYRAKNSLAPIASDCVDASEDADVSDVLDASEGIETSEGVGTHQ